MPVRGLGAKNVVFGGMRSPPSATSVISGDADGSEQHAGLGPTRRRRPADVADAVLEREVVLGQLRQGGVEADGVEGAVVDERLESVGRRRASRARARRAAPRRPASTVVGRRQRAGEVEVVGQAGQQPVDGLHGELVVDQLDDEAQGGRGPRDVVGPASSR